MDPYILGITQRRSVMLGLGVTDFALRTSHWEHPHHGVARPAGLAIDRADARIIDAIALMTQGSVLGGWAALRLQGCPYFDGIDRFGSERDVMILTEPGAQLRKRPGIRPSERLLHRGETVEFLSVRATSIARSAYDEMLTADSARDALVVAEMSVSHITPGARTTLANLSALVAGHKKTRGIAQVRAALAHASERSGSPWETHTRWFAETEVEIDGLLVNQPVFDLAGNLLGIADLLEPISGLVIESDGSAHREEVRHSRDNRREERLEHAGLVVARVTALDHRDPRALERRLRDAWHTARSTKRERAWTLSEPEWWSRWEPGRAYRLS